MAKLASGGGGSSIPAPVPAPVLPPPPIPDSILMPPPMAFPGPSAAQPAVPGEEILNSGRYYCEVCDLPLNSAFQLSQVRVKTKYFQTFLFVRKIFSVLNIFVSAASRVSQTQRKNRGSNPSPLASSPFQTELQEEKEEEGSSSVHDSTER